MYGTEWKSLSHQNDWLGSLGGEQWAPWALRLLQTSGSVKQRVAGWECGINRITGVAVLWHQWTVHEEAGGNLLTCLVDSTSQFSGEHALCDVCMITVYISSWSYIPSSYVRGLSTADGSAENSVPHILRPAADSNYVAGRKAALRYVSSRKKERKLCMVLPAPDSIAEYRSLQSHVSRMWPPNRIVWSQSSPTDGRARSEGDHFLPVQYTILRSELSHNSGPDPPWVEHSVAPLDLRGSL